MTEYEMTWRSGLLTSEAQTIDEMIVTLAAATNDLKRMKAAGVTVDPHGGADDDAVRLVTDNPLVAEEFGFRESQPVPEYEDWPEGW
jgi:hypothetical protein